MGRGEEYANANRVEDIVHDDGTRTPHVLLVVGHPRFDGEYGEVCLTPEDARVLARALVRTADRIDRIDGLGDGREGS